MDQVNQILFILNQEAPWLLWSLVVVIGGVLGSFLTCMLYRVPRKISLSNPPSYCPSCNEKLKAIDLLPVFSYLIFKGKCHYCKVPVSPRYVLIELCTIFICVLTYIITGPQLVLIFTLTWVICWLFIVGLWVESRMLAKKVLLFSIMISPLIYLLWC